MYSNLVSAFCAGFSAAFAFIFLVDRRWEMVVLNVVLCVVNIAFALL